MTKLYRSYIEFIEQLIRPLRGAHPTWRRLDGMERGGNRRIPAIIQYEGYLHRVHMDTWIERLMAPYDAWKQGRVTTPVVTGKTKNGRKMLQPAPGAGAGDHFYIYLYRLIRA